MFQKELLQLIVTRPILRPQRIQCRFQKGMRPPQQAHILPALKAAEHIRHLLQESGRIRQQPIDAGVVKEHLPACHPVLPGFRQSPRPGAHPDHPVKLRRPERQELALRQLRREKLAVLFRLDHNIVRIVIPITSRLGLSHAPGSCIIRYIYQFISIFLYLTRIEPGIYRSDEISLVIRVMDIYNVRPPVLQTVIFKIDDRHIRREVLPLIMVCPQRTVPLPVIIRNGHHIGVTVRILLRRPPDALQRVPHRSLVREKGDLQPHLDIMSDAALYPQQSRPELLIGFGAAHDSICTHSSSGAAYCLPPIPPGFL